MRQLPAKHSSPRPLTGLRVTMWCELLKAMLENRPLTLLERRPQASRRVPVQLRLI